MDGNEALARLLAVMDNEQAGEWNRPLRIIDMRQFIRAALQSITPNAGPQPRTAVDDPRDDVHLTRSQYLKFMAWEQWGREHAKPALEYYHEQHSYPSNPGPAKPALAAMPQDPQGGVR